MEVVDTNPDAKRLYERLGFFITRVALPAYIILVYWAAIQFFGSVGTPSGSGGTAFLAHLGGFIAGAVLIRFFAKPDLVAQHQRRPAEIWS